MTGRRRQGRWPVRADPRSRPAASTTPTPSAAAPTAGSTCCAATTTGIDANFAQLPTSPIKEPIAGCVLRFTPDLEAQRDRGRRLPQRLRHGLQPRRRAVHLRLGQRALRLAALVRADALLPRHPGRPSRLAVAAAGTVLADAAVLPRRGRRRSPTWAAARRPAWSAIATCSSPSSTAAASSCSTGRSARFYFAEA